MPALPIGMLSMAASNVIGPLLQRSQPQMLDQFSSNWAQLGAMGADEAMLGRLQTSLGRRSMEEAGRAFPGELDVGRLARGTLSPEAEQRIHTQAYGGLNESMRLAGNQAMERSLSAGNPFSSAMARETAYLQQPLMSEAANREQGLRAGELDRLTGLRQSLLSNMMAIQESPALARLLKTRLAQAKQFQTTMQREPGRLPGGAYNYGSMGGMAG